MAILHVCLNVSDADEAARWYTEQLEFDRTWEFTTKDGSTRNVYVGDRNGVEIQLSDTMGEEDFDGDTRWDHIAVKVEDVDSAFERIDHDTVEKPPTDQPAAGARTAIIVNPDGHRIELVGPQEN